ncbi:MAG: hypothetical protein LKCHEGNO_03228 [Burkholderiaceae bacterium]|nr:hypothetical protein [Burkholderiaceae bacterium]
MSDTIRAFVTLGADVGGRDADDATNAHVLAFRRLLADACRGSYSETIKEVALVLRIDGSVQAWGKRGVEGVALLRKGAFATADIYVTRELWASDDLPAFRKFLGSEVQAAIAAIAERARQRGVDLLRTELERDVHVAAVEFTSQ